MISNFFRPSSSQKSGATLGEKPKNMFLATTADTWRTLQSSMLQPVPTGTLIWMKGGKHLKVIIRFLWGGCLWAAANYPTILPKIIQILQYPMESPAAFLERLLVAYCSYNPIVPAAPENQWELLILSLWVNWPLAFKRRFRKSVASKVRICLN